MTLGGGTAAGFLVFASNANRRAVCDALSPVWLSDALLGGALLFGLALLSPADWKRRLALAAAAGVDPRGLPRTASGRTACSGSKAFRRKSSNCG